jgi:glycosyltransferase involved in cell wall biosynthesis
LEKKTIIHFIYNLGRGGAETMLVQVLKELKEYRNIVVILFNENHFESELECDKLICLNLKSIFSIPLAVLKFKKIIQREKPGIVHSHLIWPTMIARLATPCKITLITTVHNSVATSIDYNRWYIKILEKITYRIRKSTLIFVDNGSHLDYFTKLKLKPSKSYTLHTFVDINNFKRKDFTKQPTSTFKLISVGSLGAQKNYLFLVNAFAMLKNDDIELHIYGTGALGTQLQDKINETGANVVLKGQVNNIQEIIPEYDLFVMASLFEGFSLSVLEAMAMRMPLLLSNIPSFKEQCENCAFYFDLNDENDFIQKLKYLMEHQQILRPKAEQGYERVINNFTLEHHMKGLRKIYSKVQNEST